MVAALVQEQSPNITSPELFNNKGARLTGDQDKECGKGVVTTASGGGHASQASALWLNHGLSEGYGARLGFFE